MNHVTPIQNAYLKLLSEGPKTTRQMADHFIKSMGNTGKIIKKLRDAGLIESNALKGSTGNIWIHKLSMPYQEMDLTISRATRSSIIPLIEVEYVAELRMAGLTGSALSDAHLKKYPKRPPGVVKSLVMRARAMKLCR